MCGIAGFTGTKNTRQLTQMLEAIEHRGRDERCETHVSQMNLGMNRLAIVDLQENLYPLKYKNYTLVFNGEIYNFAELKNKLEKQGVKFKTDSDAEVILPLYHQHGARSFSMLEGMFAIAIVDTKKKELVLARDKSGEKPLYYCREKGSLGFASEIKALINWKTSQLKVPKLLMEQYLREGSLVGDKTLVKRVNKLPAASYLVWQLKNKKLISKKYWQPTSNTTTSESTEKLTKKLDSLIQQAVKSRLMSDVPVGSFMSGGVDSTLIACLAKQEIPNLRTYSISFPGFGEDESSYSQLAAQKLGTNHTEIACTPEKIRPIVDSIGQYIDEPIVDTAVLPTFLLVEEARKSVKVALSGEGADELFAGYHRYQRYLKAKKISSLLPSEVWQELIKVIPGRWKEKFIRATTPLSKSYSSQNIWSAAELGQLVVGSSYQPQKKQPSAELFRNNPLLAMQLTDYHHWLPEQLLMKIDKISMTQNLEARSPFLDTELINFAFSLPNKHKHMFGQNKYLLRKVAACYLPKEIAWKNKHGFEVPLNDWFRKELRDVVEDMVDELGKLNKIFDKNYLNQIKDEHFSGKQQHRDKIWSLVVLSKWLEKHRAEIEI